MNDAERDRKLFGRNITSLRHQRGLSKAALARKADVSRDSLRQIEAEFRTAHFDTLVALADALGVDPGALLNGLRPGGAACSPTVASKASDGGPNLQASDDHCLHKAKRQGVSTNGNHA